MENNVQNLREEAKICEREILSLLLEISKSFSDENFSKSKRNEMFLEIDNLRDKVKDISKVINDLQKAKEDKEIYILDTEVKKEEIKEIVENVEEIAAEIIEETIDNLENEIEEDIEEDIKEESEDKIQENEEVRHTRRKRNVEDNLIDEDNEKKDNLDFDLEEKINVSVESENLPSDNFKEQEEKEDELIQEIEEIDKLIDEAQNLNSNIIKFPESNKRTGYSEFANVNERISQNITNKEVNSIKEDYDDTVIEPVPVLFGNRRAQNQMVVKKKSNSFSDKLRVLMFKIKTMIGRENEEE